MDIYNYRCLYALMIVLNSQIFSCIFKIEFNVRVYKYYNFMCGCAITCRG